MGAAAVIAAGFGAMFAAASRGGDSSISADTAVALYDRSGALVGNVSPVLFAVLVAATAVVGFRTGTFPAWLNWVSAVLAVVLLSPFSWLVLPVVLLWIAWMSLSMFARVDSAVG